MWVSTNEKMTNAYPSLTEISTTGKIWAENVKYKESKCVCALPHSPLVPTHCALSPT